MKPTWVVLITVTALLALGSSCRGKSDQPVQRSDEEVTEKMIHHFTLSDGWVPSDKEALKKMINGFLEKVKQEAVIKDKIRGLVCPHAGYSYAGQGAAYAYNLIKGQSYKRVFIIGPSHYVGFRGISVTSATHYETPLGEVPVDTAVCRALLREKPFCNVPTTEEKEHSVQIQIPFLQTVLKDFRIVPLVVGNLTVEEMRQAADLIQPYVDEETLVIASSDFTHYGESFRYTPFSDHLRENIARGDMQAVDYINSGDVDGLINYVDQTDITICGNKPISLMMMILPDTSGELLHYYMSGDRTGSFQESVSYAAIALTDYKLTEEDRAALLKLARQTLRTFLKDHKKPAVDAGKLSAALLRPRGVFVTLNKKGYLRGCIGCIPLEGYHNIPPLYQGVINYAINAAVNDSRFREMTPEEEPQVDIEISVLSSLKRVKGPEDIVVGKHGVYLVKGNATGVFLPQVAPEQGWDKETMLNELASQKAGLPESAWKDKDTVLYVFTAQVFGEK